MQSPSIALLRDDSAAREGGYLPLWHEHVVCGTEQTFRSFCVWELTPGPWPCCVNLSRFLAGDWKLYAITWSIGMTLSKSPTCHPGTIPMPPNSAPRWNAGRGWDKVKLFSFGNWKGKIEYDVGQWFFETFTKRIRRKTKKYEECFSDFSSVRLNVLSMQHAMLVCMFSQVVILQCPIMFASSPHGDILHHVHLWTPNSSGCAERSESALCQMRTVVKGLRWTTDFV